MTEKLLECVGIIASLVGAFVFIDYLLSFHTVSTRSLQRLAKKHGLFVELRYSLNTSGYRQEPELIHVEFYTLSRDWNFSHRIYDRKRVIVIRPAERDHSEKFKLHDYRRIIDAYKNRGIDFGKQKGVKFFD